MTFFRTPRSLFDCLTQRRARGLVDDDDDVTLDEEVHKVPQLLPTFTDTRTLAECLKDPEVAGTVLKLYLKSDRLTVPLLNDTFKIKKKPLRAFCTRYGIDWKPKDVKVDLMTKVVDYVSRHPCEARRSLSGWLPTATFIAQSQGLPRRARRGYIAVVLQAPWNLALR